MSIIALMGGQPLQAGSQNSGAVLALQQALFAAGYRVGQDGVFGPRTDMVVRQFQRQHHLGADGVVGPITAGLLDGTPPDKLIAQAKPLIHVESYLPHDDTASLVAFYGNPESPAFTLNLVDVKTPFPLTYEGKSWPHPIKFHKRCADRFSDAFSRIWRSAGQNPESPILRRISRFSGSYNDRSIRGATRKSCHAFGAALDVDAEDLPMSHAGIDPETMPIEVVRAFDAAGLFWGNRYTGRKDPMHWQAAHE